MKLKLFAIVVSLATMGIYAGETTSPSHTFKFIKVEKTSGLFVVDINRGNAEIWERVYVGSKDKPQIFTADNFQLMNGDTISISKWKGFDVNYTISNQTPRNINLILDADNARIEEFKF